MINLETKIKRKLKEKALSIEKLAVYSCVTKQTIHNIFKKNDIKVSHLQRISEVLNVDVEYFFLGVEDLLETVDILEKPKLNQLEMEVNSLKRENQLLREMMDLLKEKESS
jgi:transcriptional regulator with XRE-family HTH domain